MAVQSKRQRRDADKARKAEAAALPKAEPMPIVSERRPDYLHLAKEAEAVAASCAVAQAEARLGRMLSPEERKAIRAEHGLAVIADREAPAASRIKSRDGLHSLASSGGITVAQHKAGLAYRMCFEASAAGLKSALANAGMIGGGGTHGGFALTRDKAAIQRAYLMARLAGFDRAVQPGDLAVLRAVAGEGRTLRSLAPGGNAYASAKASLVRALVVIEGGLRIGTR